VNGRAAHAVAVIFRPRIILTRARPRFLARERLVGKFRGGRDSKCAAAAGWIAVAKRKIAEIVCVP
jgi:hypothetical protein